jgi:rRNA maturation RNase YbeY
MTEFQADLAISNQTKQTIPLDRSEFKKLLAALSEKEEVDFSFIEVVYVDEQEIIRINKEYLDHDYVTDIITFPYEELSELENIEGTLFCCASRILEQAKEFGAEPKKEFLRVFIHGLLHLAGYNDKSEEQQAQMKAKENSYLELVDSF